MNVVTSYYTLQATLRESLGSYHTLFAIANAILFVAVAETQFHLIQNTFELILRVGTKGEVTTIQQFIDIMKA